MPRYSVLSVFPVFYNIYWQLIYFIQGSLFLLISYSWLAPPSSPSPVVATTLQSLSVCFRSHTEMATRSICLSRSYLTWRDMQYYSAMDMKAVCHLQQQGWTGGYYRFIHRWTLRCFHIWAFVNNTMWTWEVPVSIRIHVFLSSDFTQERSFGSHSSSA